MKTTLEVGRMEVSLLFLTIALQCGFAASTNVTAAVASRVTLTCLINGTFTFPRWYGLDQETLNNNRTRFRSPEYRYAGQKDLLILSLTFNHSGQYRCETDGQEATIYLMVYGPPTEIAIRHDHTDDFRNWNITCSVTSHPQSEVKWTLDGDVLETGSDPRVNTSISNCRLMNQQYTCAFTLILMNQTRHDNNRLITCDFIFMDQVVQGRNTSVKVPFPPSAVHIVFPYKSITLFPEPYSVNVTCITDSALAPSRKTSGVVFTWSVMFKGQAGFEPVNLTSPVTSYTPSTDTGFVTSQTGWLTIRNTFDGAVLKCSVRQYPSTDSTERLEDHTHKMNLNYGPIVDVPKRYIWYTHIDDTVVIPCVCRSKPVSNISWYRRDNGQRVLIVDNDQDSNVLDLVIHDFKAGDEGQYECHVDNNIGDGMQKLIRISVVDKPEIPPLTYSPSLDDDGGIIVGFTTPTYLPPVDSIVGVVTFNIQYSEGASSTQQWVEIPEVLSDTASWLPAHQYTLVLSRSLLKPGITYSFRIKAVSQANTVSYSTAIYAEAAIPEPEAEPMVTQEDWRKDIIISVMVTAVGLILVIAVIVCVVRRTCSI